MGRLDEFDLSLKLPQKKAKKRLREEQRQLLARRLRLAGLVGDGDSGAPVCSCVLAIRTTDRPQEQTNG